MADSHEVYPNAPISLVAVEIRFPDGSASGQATSRRPSSGPSLAANSERLGGGKTPTQRVALTMVPGGAGAQNVETVVVPRSQYGIGQSRSAVTPEGMTIEKRDTSTIRPSEKSLLVLLTQPPRSFYPKACPSGDAVHR